MPKTAPRQASPLTANRTVTREQTCKTGSRPGRLGLATLAAGLTLFGAQAASAQEVVLTVEYIKSVKPSDGTDGATSALFGVLGAAAAAAITVGTAGAGAPITAGMMVSAAGSGAGSGFGVGSFLGDTFRGADDVYFTIRGNTVWPVEGYSRSMDAGDIERVDMTFGFNNQAGVILALWERDTASANDFMGQQEFKNLELPFDDEVVIANESENSFYLVKVKVAAVPVVPAGCVEVYPLPDGNGQALQLCGAASNWADYINLGSPGNNSHHYSVASFRCGAGVRLIQFVAGNLTPRQLHNETCVTDAYVNANPWVNTNATGIAFIR
tara:strand:- start:209 stop:1186 length:978 start_codon:yes stop_codon:yes gene_type:complete